MTQSPGDGSVVVEFRAVEFAYPGRTIVAGFDLTIPRGDVLALVGRSGAGKSTVLRLVNRLLLPQAGTVFVEGRDTREWDAIALRRRTGYVLQDVGLFPHLSIEENVALVLRLQGVAVAERHARAVQLLALGGLPADDYAHRWPAELSGGQRQRVGVARALAARPPVLLMDEPFGALDPLTRLELRREFQRIQRELQQTAIIVTHDIAEAFTLGTRVGVLDEGRLIACDTPEVVAKSTDPRVRRFLDTLALPVSPERRSGEGGPWTS